MTTLCRIVLAVVTCTADPETPKPSPAEAVEILRASGTRFFIPDAPKPWEAYNPYDDESPFNTSFTPTWPQTERRLDGTSIYDPPIVYGAVPFYRYGRHGFNGANVVVPGYYYGPPRTHGYRGRIHDQAGRGAHRAGEATPAGRGGRGARGPAPAPRGNGQPGTRAAAGGARVTPR